MCHSTVVVVKTIPENVNQNPGKARHCNWATSKYFSLVASNFGHSPTAISRLSPSIPRNQILTRYFQWLTTVSSPLIILLSSFWSWKAAFNYKTCWFLVLSLEFNICFNLIRIWNMVFCLDSSQILIQIIIRDSDGKVETL